MSAMASKQCPCNLCFLLCACGLLFMLAVVFILASTADPLFYRHIDAEALPKRGWRAPLISSSCYLRGTSLGIWIAYVWNVATQSWLHVFLLRGMSRCLLCTWITTSVHEAPSFVPAFSLCLPLHHQLRFCFYYVGRFFWENWVILWYHKSPLFTPFHFLKGVSSAVDTSVVFF